VKSSRGLLPLPSPAVHVESVLPLLALLDNHGSDGAPQSSCFVNCDNAVRHVSCASVSGHGLLASVPNRLGTCTGQPMPAPLDLRLPTYFTEDSFLWDHAVTELALLQLCKSLEDVVRLLNGAKPIERSSQSGFTGDMHGSVTRGLSTFGFWNEPLSDRRHFQSINMDIRAWVHDLLCIVLSVRKLTRVPDAHGHRWLISVLRLIYQPHSRLRWFRSSMVEIAASRP